eukprot:TRINITY_DN3938_c0_g1_i2.p1 TRINITY_DN3938_c0_g1~~TRINITY_DN3938_c0_g1_i2.p1  ORF type:complete len:213 (+),score=-1.16 TRINITY_DN3938_c0_g1_i2:24-662(+)
MRITRNLLKYKPNTRRLIIRQKHSQNHQYSTMANNQSIKVIGPADIDEVNPNKGAEIPKYMHDVYWFWYINPTRAKMFNRELVVNSVLWGNADRLENEVLKEIKEGDRVLQSAATYGKLIRSAGERVGKSGFFDVLDICPVQIKLHANEVEHLPNTVRLRVGDARSPLLSGEPLYDLAYCFMLLHEVPEDYKHSIVDQTLLAVKPGKNSNGS